MHAPTRYDNTQISAFIGVVAFTIDAQIKSLIVVDDIGPVEVVTIEGNPTVFVHAPYPTRRGMGQLPYLVLGLLEHQLAPEIVFIPAVLNAAQIDRVIDVQIFEQVKQEQRYPAIVRGNQVGEWAGTTNTRIDFTQIRCAIVGIEQEVHAENSLVTFLVESVAESGSHVA